VVHKTEIIGASFHYKHVGVGFREAICAEIQLVAGRMEEEESLTHFVKMASMIQCKAYSNFFGLVVGSSGECDPDRTAN